MVIDHTVRAVGLHLQLVLPLIHSGLLPLSGIPCRVRFPEADCEGLQLDDDYHVKMIPVSVSSGPQVSTAILILPLPWLLDCEDRPTALKVDSL